SGSRCDAGNRSAEPDFRVVRLKFRCRDRTRLDCAARCRAGERNWGCPFTIQDNLEQEAATYDTVNGNIYVRGGDANDISVINASTFTNVANILAPIDNQQTFYVPPVAVDNETGYLYSTNAGVSSNVSIITGVTETVTGSIPVGGSPHGIAFDWRNHDFYVADWGTSNITVFSADTNKTLTSISVGTDPLAVVYDTSANRVFVTNYGSGN